MAENRDQDRETSGVLGRIRGRSKRLNHRACRGLHAKLSEWPNSFLCLGFRRSVWSLGPFVIGQTSPNGLMSLNCPEVALQIKSTDAFLLWDACGSDYFDDSETDGQDSQ